ncbi:hypothetical protein BDP81DRAFT_459203 [Colletotrichum phormii]|uniref:Heterokaryon incompatibility domain-containing protein n=1 Tax=Colletotrichum phormii TaxID=359342 RepID=A0AAI9ZZP5_9PEZI|nr:uncharacterized protein BDP81DRAFT_459203 [Colletotrichum phormii]KAK1639873.1 hypothetical protein BDP81DRAFT_459203 [Colletotrichum phormii]
MRLLSTTAKKLEVFDLGNAPPYAALSHLWEHDEVLFQDMGDLATAARRSGFRKIESACSAAEMLGLNFIWIDTCCMDKESEAERSEAVESSFRTFRSAAVCIAYLSDVDMQADSFRRSRWFSRSWTLQELIAPTRLVFFTREWQLLNSRSELRSQLYDITGIDPFVLEGGDLAKVSVARKMFWATNRNAYRLEDIAYSLSGLFGVEMMPIYGEGNVNAFLRLQEHIAKTVKDPTLFAWRSPPRLFSKQSKCL